MTLFPKPTHRADRQAARQAEAIHDRAVYKAVDLRDGFRCRVCTRALTMRGDLITDGHRHHIKFLSLGGTTETDNVLLLCAGCHADIHAHRLEIAGDADGEIQTTWRLRPCHT